MKENSIQFTPYLNAYATILCFYDTKRQCLDFLLYLRIPELPAQQLLESVYCVLHVGHLLVLSGNAKNSILARERNA